MVSLKRGPRRVNDERAQAEENKQRLGPPDVWAHGLPEPSRAMVVVAASAMRKVSAIRESAQWLRRWHCLDGRRRNWFEACEHGFGFRHGLQRDAIADGKELVPHRQ